MTLSNEAIQRYCRIPLLTLFTVFLCSSLYLIDEFEKVDIDHDDVCLKAHGIIRLNEFYRLFAHVTFHKNLLHLVVTMIPFASLGWIIERRLGTIFFLFNVIIIWLFSSLLEVAMTTLLYHIDHDLFHGCSIGMSGLMFGLVVLVTKFTKHKDGRPWWGVPSIVYPLTLLGMFYLFIRRGSLLMHIGGIFAGYACKYEILACVLPYPERVVSWERTYLQPLTQIPCFIRFVEPATLPVYNTCPNYENEAQDF